MGHAIAKVHHALGRQTTVDETIPQIIARCDEEIYSIKDAPCAGEVKRALGSDVGLQGMTQQALSHANASPQQSPAAPMRIALRKLPPASQ
jgi:hypothetical protein